MNAIHANDFDLSSTLESGQMFRYVRTREGYLVHQRDRVFELWQKGGELCFEGVGESFTMLTTLD